ncbi:hypothetical protein PG994_001345 [Apiospora phragmitis]|uniref:Uncharacterized protein n=1 Tax=Apiospora phragmitis TaxID=2905665 RepID=A0ABR1WT93_9PEZI
METATRPRFAYRLPPWNNSQSEDANAAAAATATTAGLSTVLAIQYDLITSPSFRLYNQNRMRQWQLLKKGVQYVSSLLASASTAIARRRRQQPARYGVIFFDLIFDMRVSWGLAGFIKRQPLYWHPGGYVAVKPQKRAPAPNGC